MKTYLFLPVALLLLLACGSPQPQSANDSPDSVTAEPPATAPDQADAFTFERTGVAEADAMLEAFNAEQAAFLAEIDAAAISTAQDLQAFVNSEVSQRYDKSLRAMRTELNTYRETAELTPEQAQVFDTSLDSIAIRSAQRLGELNQKLTNSQ